MRYAISVMHHLVDILDMLDSALDLTLVSS